MNDIPLYIDFPEECGWPRIQLWPDPKAGIPYGPTGAHQEALFIDYFPREIRPHLHSQDVLLSIGGAGAGKTAVTVARIAEVVIKHPNVKAVVGGKNFPLIKRIVTDHYKRIFSLPGGYWDHPIVKRRPLQNDLILHLKNGSRITFLNLEDPDVVRGIDIDILQIEEVNLLPSAESLDVMVRNCRGRALKIKQLLLTCNPEEAGGWINQKFLLQQLDEKFIGKKLPIGQRCSCQFCQNCLNSKQKQISWINDSCPECKLMKDNDCPGNQEFYRVILSKSYQNLHNASDFVQNMKSALDAESFERFVEGKIFDSRKGKIYTSFKVVNNVELTNILINWNKDIIWTHDFNVAPMCSVVLQEEDWGTRVIDEIVKYDATVPDVVAIFAERYPPDKVKGTVHLYGDPSGLWGTGNTGRATYFQQLVDEMTKHGYKFVLHMKRIKKQIKISRIDRINNVNACLLNADNEVRIKINSSCQHLIKSLAEVQWKPGGNEEDDKCDKLAQKHPNKNMVHLLTHPAEALGYYIYKRFPIIVQKPTEYYAAIQGEVSLKVQDGKIVETDLKKDKQPKSAFAPKPVKSILGDMGYFLNNNIKERKSLETNQNP